MSDGIRLSSRARSALDAICDTFAPGGDGLPSATELRVPEALLAASGVNPMVTIEALAHMNARGIAAKLS